MSVQTMADTLQATLKSFKAPCELVQIDVGPSVTRFAFRPAEGIKVNKIQNLASDLSLAVASPKTVRIEAPIPGMTAVGIEVPNSCRETISWLSMLDEGHSTTSKMKLPMVLGKDIVGNPIFADLAKLPHLLIAGTTGSGKSVCMNSIILSILYGAAERSACFIMIDPKMVEFNVYKGLQELEGDPINDPKEAVKMLGRVVATMDSRYAKIAGQNVRDIDAYNAKVTKADRLTRVVVFIDEFADLMQMNKETAEIVSNYVQRIGQKGRAAGIHLVIATQRPSVDVITGVIKANLPGRIALTTASAVDSKTIINSAGAETLLGNGDMLYSANGGTNPQRIQGCFISDEDTETLVRIAKEA